MEGEEEGKEDKRKNGVRDALGVGVIVLSTDGKKMHITHKH